MAYFDYLDHKGGFFYERWGDAPVHSIAASLFLPKRDIHFFNDLGYYHVTSTPVFQLQPLSFVHFNFDPIFGG